MKRTYLFSIFLIIGLGTISAQSFIGKLNQNPTSDYKRYTENDTLKILAVMSDFQVDIDDATFGDGKFGTIYSQDYGSNILDPLPHDKAYFENHLTFVKNYFAKVSGGKLNISFTVLDDILTVSKTMRNYTPPIDDLNDHTPLGEYVEEVWQLADKQYPNFDFSQYELFFVFHAGAGKDVSLPGSLGNERDLPSVYLNQKSLRNIFGTNFDGFPVNGGNFKIANSAILPETESREIKGFNGIKLLELTTNGLIAATVGSHLGLPDLYNTETGRSAIGRFGLMDGQSMFTYQGISPPEPSAWEKMFLGWVTPTEISIGDAKLNLVNRYAANLGDTSLIKIPINATEYYLIENRKRDANKDGSTVTYISNGQTLTKTFDRDFPNYIYYNVDTLKGVIIDVDEYDWALPGGDRNSKIEKFEDLGLIIWHIDERIINDNYESNTINNDRYKRGVALVEADGIRDIGETFKTIFGETVVGEGTKEDTWYKKNPSDYYKNKFSADTKPKAESNTNANSLITLTNFSEISNRMSFNISFGSENIDLIGNAALPDVSEYRLWMSSANLGDSSFIFVANSEKIYSLDIDGNINNEIDFPNIRKHAVYTNDSAAYVISVADKQLQITKFEPNLEVIANIENTSSRFFTAPVIYSSSGDILEILVGTIDGEIIKYSINIASEKTFELMESKKIFDNVVIKITSNENEYSAISVNYFWSSQFASTLIELSDSPLSIVSTRNSDGSFKSIVQLFNGDIVEIVGKNVTYINPRSVDNITNLPKDNINLPLLYNISLADIKNDGENYILRNTESYLNSFNMSGSMGTNFPYQDEFNSTFYSTPLAVDLNNDDAADIISFTTNGKIIAVDGITGKMIDGFPISSGGKIATTPVVFTENGRTALGVITENNQFMSWNISKYDGKQFWTEENGNASNSSSVAAASSSEKVLDFFPQSQAYNWPNPVYDGVTNIRYFVSEDSDAIVTIFDLAGDLVAKLNGRGIGGLDNEIIWNVNEIQSGLYFAHLQVTSSSGKTDTKIIKIAVIK